MKKITKLFTAVAAGLFPTTALISASCSTTENSKYGFEIDPKDSKTIGGYVYALLVKNAEEPEIGVIVDDGKCIYQIMSMSSGGVIETVSIEKIDKN